MTQISKNTIPSKLFYKNGVPIFLKIDDGMNITKIWKSINKFTYSVIFSYLKKFKEYGLIETIKKGRINTIILTKKGKEFQLSLIKSKEVLENES